MFDTKMFESLYKEIQKLAKSTKLPTQEVRMNQKAMARGLEVSQMACRQPKYAYISPLLRSMLKWDDQSKNLDVDSKLMPEEVALYKKLLKQVETMYDPDSTGALSAKWHKKTCMDNLKENMRHQVPGQAKARIEFVKDFVRPTADVDILSIVRNNATTRIALDWIMDHTPWVKSTDEYTMVYMPFEKKDSNVGWYYFINDRLEIEELGVKAGLWAIEVAKKLPLSELWRWMIYALYGKNERGKGRAIMGGSRVVAVSLNRLNGPEQRIYRKKCPFFAGWNDREYLRKVLLSMGKKADSIGYTLVNSDASGYDRTVPESAWYLIGALSMMRTSNKEGKEIAKYRAALATKGVLLNGPEGKVQTIYGRILSGYLDTQRGGTFWRIFTMVDALVKFDKDWKNTTYDVVWSIIAQSDDVLYYVRPEIRETVQKYLHDTYGIIENFEKGETGAFFLQWRVYEDKENKIVMTYPWTRVVRNMLYKKEPKALGKYGWLMSYLQSLDTIKEDSENFPFVVKLLIEHDPLRLGTGLTAEELIAGVKKEDEEALKNAKAGQKVRFKTTLQRLFENQDPSDQNTMVLSETEWDSGYVNQILNAVKRAAMS